MSEKDAQPSVPGPGVGGRLTREAALALLERGNELLASGDFGEAGQHFSRVVGFDDPAITAAALLGLGEAHYRLNNEPAAVQSWMAVLQLPETPSTYPAWRNVAAARVRDGDLTGAIQAYREADKRAPREDKAEIASRLGWLSKETGDARASKRYFAKGRGDRGRLTMTLVIIAVTSIVSLTVMFSSEGDAILAQLWLTKAGIVAGEYWRLWTVTLVHDPVDPLHLIFNMFALYVAGTIVERWYGSLRFLAIYLACAAAGSTASIVFGSGGPSVGASGAIMGLFGVLLAAGRIHHPVDREARAMASRLVIFIVITLGFGFISNGAVDNAAHIGGLVAGLWLGALVPPTGVPTLSSLWRQPDGSRSATGRASAPGYILAVGIAVVGVVVVAGVALGTGGRTVIPDPTQTGERATVALAQSVGGSVSEPAGAAGMTGVVSGNSRGGSGAATAASTEK